MQKVKSSYLTLYHNKKTSQYTYIICREGNLGDLKLKNGLFKHISGPRLGPKTNETFLRISALASKKGSNQKIKALYYTNYGLFRGFYQEVSGLFNIIGILKFTSNVMMQSQLLMVGDSKIVEFEAGF